MYFTPRKYSTFWRPCCGNEIHIMCFRAQLFSLNQNLETIKERKKEEMNKHKHPQNKQTKSQQQQQY